MDKRLIWAVEEIQQKCYEEKIQILSVTYDTEYNEYGESFTVGLIHLPACVTVEVMMNGDDYEAFAEFQIMDTVDPDARLSGSWPVGDFSIKHVNEFCENY